MSCEEPQIDLLLRLARQFGMEMSLPGAGNLYAFENTGLIKGFVIDKRLGLGATFRADDKQTADTLTGIVTLQRTCKEAD